MELNERLNFESFVCGDENRVALDVAAQPAKYDLVTIAGRGTGVGVTHLLQALCWKLGDEHPERTCCYTDGKEFFVEYVDALQSGELSEFRAKYAENPGVLVFDVLQFLRNKEHSPEELFWVVQRLLQQGKTVIMGGGSPAEMFSGLNCELRSRFEGGLVVEIDPLGYELRKAILTKLQDEHRLDLSETVIEVLAICVRGNARRLEGAIKQLSARHSLDGLPITVRVVDELIESFAKP